MIWQAGLGLAGQLIGLFGDAGKAKQEALKQTAANFQRTWVDELIVLYWFTPSVLDWVGISRPLQTFNAMDSDILQIQLAISAAVFGLNKLAGKRD